MGGLGFRAYLLTLMKTTSHRYVRAFSNLKGARTQVTGFMGPIIITLMGDQFLLLGVELVKLFLRSTGCN